MGYFKLTTSDKKEYREPIDVTNLIFYVCNLEKNSKGLFGTNQILNRGYIPFPDNIASQFLCVQNSYKGNYSRRVYHVIFRLDEALDNVTYPVIFTIGQALLRVYPQYQSFFAVHDNQKKNLHLHMVINNIPIYDNMETLSHYIDSYNLERMIDIVNDEFDWYYSMHSIEGHPDMRQIYQRSVNRYLSAIQGV